MRIKLTVACALTAFVVVAGGTAEATGLIHTNGIAKGAITFDRLSPGVQKKVSAKAVPGPAGATGLPGVNGAPGAPGAAGAQGAKGDSVATGLQGPKGDTGATGQQGVKGDAGATGPKGDAGVAGPKGDAGAPGASGLNGEMGARGPVGPSGAPGPAGPAGPPGTATTSDVRVIALWGGQQPAMPVGTPFDTQLWAAQIPPGRYLLSGHAGMKFSGHFAASVDPASVECHIGWADDPSQPPLIATTSRNSFAAETGKQEIEFNTERTFGLDNPNVIEELNVTGTTPRTLEARCTGPAPASGSGTSVNVSMTLLLTPATIVRLYP